MPGNGEYSKASLFRDLLLIEAQREAVLIAIQMTYESYVPLRITEAEQIRISLLRILD